MFIENFLTLGVRFWNLQFSSVIQVEDLRGQMKAAEEHENLYDFFPEFQIMDEPGGEEMEEYGGEE